MADPASDAIDETGMLVRDGGGFRLQRDTGGSWRLELSRTPIDLVAKRVRVIGLRIGDDVVQAEGVQRA